MIFPRWFWFLLVMTVLAGGCAQASPRDTAPDPTLTPGENGMLATPLETLPAPEAALPLASPARLAEEASLPALDQPASQAGDGGIPTPTAPAPPNPTPEPTFLPTSSPEPVVLPVTIWPTDPLVPILAYHRFAPDTAPQSTAVKVRLSDFKAQLQALYDAGFSLVSLAGWLDGKLDAPPGRRPLIFTMDDLFFNNQITLLEDGSPSLDSGLGVLYQFSQEHPDFGLEGALFINLGDKLYADEEKPDWEDKLAQAIVWVTENNLVPYNHFYTHPRLDLTTPRGIEWEASMNDTYLRRLLAKAGRSDLVERLGNIFALTYGVWPDEPAGVNALLHYKTPEGWPVQAVMEVDYIYRPAFMLPPYASGFDRFHIPRMVGYQPTVDYLVANQADFPAAQVCQLGPLNDLPDPSAVALGQLAQGAVAQGACPAGVYVLPGGVVFRVFPDRIEPLLPVPGNP